MRFFVCILVLLFVHNQFSRADKTLTDDSLYTEKSGIFIFPNLGVLCNYWTKRRTGKRFLCAL
jgi:hypothetical protein